MLWPHSAAGGSSVSALAINDDQLRNQFEDWSWAQRDLTRSATVHHGSPPSAWMTSSSSIRRDRHSRFALYLDYDGLGHSVAGEGRTCYPTRRNSGWPVAVPALRGSRAESHKSPGQPARRSLGRPRLSRDSGGRGG